MASMEIDYQDLPQYDDFKIEIKQDEDAQNPRDLFDYASTVCTFEGKIHWCSDKNAEDLFSNLKDVQEYIKENNCVFLPIYRYGSHEISTSSYVNPYDVNLSGAIFMTPEEIQKHFNKPLDECKDEVLQKLEKEINTLNSWLTGDTYYYQIKKDDNIVDSCYGFYGINGCMSEALSEYKWYVDNWQTPEKALEYVQENYTNFENIPRTEQTAEMAEFYLKAGGDLEKVSDTLREELNLKLQFADGSTMSL